MKAPKTLEQLNPLIHPDELRVYLDAKKTYEEAMENITKNGSVNAHPKTGAPIVNPYLAIRDLCGKTIVKFHRDNPCFESLK